MKKQLYAYRGTLSGCIRDLGATMAQAFADAPKAELPADASPLFRTVASIATPARSCEEIIQDAQERQSNAEGAVVAQARDMTHEQLTGGNHGNAD